MGEVLTFRYSIFYVLQPIIGTVILCFVLVLMVYFRPEYFWQNYQFVPWTILLCFIISSILIGFSIILKRIKAPKKIRLNEKSISALYRNGKVIQILFDNIEDIRIRRSRWKLGQETIEISSKDSSGQIICDGDLQKYEVFRGIIIEKDKNKVM